MLFIPKDELKIIQYKFYYKARLRGIYQVQFRRFLRFKQTRGKTYG